MWNLESGARGRTNCPSTAPMHISLFVLSIGYVLVGHCQQARCVHQFVHQYGAAWPTPLPHVYIHGQLQRSVTDSVNHIQLPLMALTWVTKILINVFRQSRCQIRVKIFVFFYNGDDRNDRNDKESEKSYVRAIARGLWISCHSCHLCHWGTTLIWPTYKPLVVCW